jgi:hypothetical protein
MPTGETLFSSDSPNRLLPRPPPFPASIALRAPSLEAAHVEAVVGGTRGRLHRQWVRESAWVTYVASGRKEVVATAREQRAHITMLAGKEAQGVGMAGRRGASPWKGSAEE